MRKEGLSGVLLAAGIFFLTPCVLADWGPVKRLTWTSGTSYDPAMAIDSSDAIHIVWYDYTPGNYEIYYKSSPDGGASWSPAKRLTWTSGGSKDPAIAVDSENTIHIVWYDDTPGNEELYYKRSGDGGTTWSATQRLTWTSDSSYDPVMAVDSSDTIHVAWYDYTPGDPKIYGKRSGDGGASWSAAKRLSWTSDSSYDPVMAVDSSDTLHIFWTDEAPGNGEIYYRRSTDGGISWSPAKRLTWTSGWSEFPALAIDSSDDIHVVWYDRTPENIEIYHKKSTDGGTTWSAAQRITWTSGNSYSPVIAADAGGALHVVWSDETPDVPEIYYKNSTDGGSTWGPVERLTWTSGQSCYPVLAIDSSQKIHVVWEDDTPGNFEIFYRKGN